MRIVQLLTASTGGIGRHVGSVASRLAGAGHQVLVICPPATAEAHGFAQLGLTVRPLSRLGAIGGADIVHAHGYKAGALALPLIRSTRTPLVVSWHNAVLGHGAAARAGRALQRLVARGADLTLGASSDLVDQARVLGARRAELAPVAAPAMATPAVSREEQRRRWGIGPDDIAVLTVSRLAPQKNLGLLLDIAAGVRDDPRLQFLVAGDGPEHQALAARVAADRSRVRFLGRQGDIPALLSAADLMLLTSFWEARALVAQEALLAGLPLVSTAVGGIPELVGDAALLFAVDDPDAGVRAVHELATQPHLRSSLAAAGRRRSSTWPDEDDVAADLLARYDRLVNRHASRRARVRSTRYPEAG